MGGRLSGPVHLIVAQQALLNVRNCLSLIMAANTAFHPHEVYLEQPLGLCNFTMAFPATDFLLGMNPMLRWSNSIIWPSAGPGRNDLPLFPVMTEQAFLTPRLGLIDEMTLHACLVRRPLYLPFIDLMA